MGLFYHQRGLFPLEYYLKPHSSANRLKADLHAMHELNEQTNAEAERLKAENTRLKAQLLAAEYQTMVLAELGHVLSKPATPKKDA